MAEMTPMDAWKIISRNLMQLYKLRAEFLDVAYTQEDIQAEVMCYMALKEMEKKDSKNGKKQTKKSKHKKV
jgi:hypothetical protein